MSWRAEKFRQPIAEMESLGEVERRGHFYEGDRGRRECIGLVMGQPRCLEKPTFHLLGGWFTLR